MKKVIAIVGPTATGKTSLSIKLAKKFGGEIISADSRQIYKGLDIGTGKITKREMQGVPHYMLSFLQPKKTFSAFDFAKRGNNQIAKIDLAIIVGGTGFWIDVLFNPNLLGKAGPNLQLRKRLEKKSAVELFAQLNKIDLKRARYIERTNKRRLIRAIEIALSASTKQKAVSSQLIYNFEVLWIGLDLPNAQLKRKIRKRFIQWLKQGLIAETKKLRKQVSKKRLKEIGLAYPIITEYLDGKISKSEMIERSVNSIYHYAKRQKTWFRKNQKIHWVKNKKQAIQQVMRFLK